ncbi:MAG: hypothetical protein JO270_03465 [Acidobacteriaceae bacterium]|nr:hypothetical protein [Acidobacteriaceae bacterium]MBV8523152.1 hypothetical protein [Acetobacteraceae bacterium]
MKTMLVAISALGMAGTAAFAAPPSYNVGGNPFPFRAPGTTTIPAPGRFDTGSESYPSLAASGVSPAEGYHVLSTTGSESPVQSANSVPPNFFRGTVTYYQDKSVDRSREAKAKATVIRAAQFTERR